MQHSKISIFIILSFVFSSTCFPQTPPKPAASNRDLSFEKGANEFSIKLYRKLMKEESGNLFLSPFNISCALAMTYGSASGETAKQMARLLGYPEDPHALAISYQSIARQIVANPEKDGNEIAMANAIWGQKDYGFLDSFINLVNKGFGGGFSEVDFIGSTEQARQTINGWVEEQTRKKIQELIPPGVLDAETRLVLTSAIYFNCNWMHSFRKDMTKPALFTSPASTSTVSLMSKEAVFPYLEKPDLQVLELPYKGDALSMVVLLPRGVDGLAQLEQNLSMQRIDAWLAEIRQREVHVYLPKFKMTKDLDLGQHLASLGMSDAFISGKANFSGMDGKRELYITKVLHKAYVDVDEEGTEAAAATAVIIGMGGMEPPKPVFRADHPFLFLIWHKPSGTILFMGRVMEPRAD